MIALIQEGKPLPLKYRSSLFTGDDGEYVEATKDYRLVYTGKMPKEAVLRTTPAAPLQQIRSFNTDNPFKDNWRNMLIFGDNLLALKALYNDQQGPDKYRTKNRIKLIYIDPPFATRQDFMKDREKAYRDKVIGAQFIEFLRRRLILMREILSDDGAIYVHLDTKKSHYIKAILDEIFNEVNFRSEIIWKRQSAHSDSSKFGAIHDTIFFLTKSDRWVWNEVLCASSPDYIAGFFDQIEKDSERRYARGDLTAGGLSGGGYDYEFQGIRRVWRYPKERLEKLQQEGRLHWPKNGVPRLKRYLDEFEGVPAQDVWTDISVIHNQSPERVGYPTQKPEALLERIISASSNAGDIVLDAFMGSGTTSVIAEKLGRRWIGMDCGKLAIYSTQKRLLHLNSKIGPSPSVNSREHERVADFDAHSKAASRGLLMVYEKARKGDLNITDGLLRDMADFLEKHLSGNSRQEFSLICPENKFRVRELEVMADDMKAGEKAVQVGKVRFLISFIQPKKRPEKPKPLKAKEFALYHAGIYDKDLILSLPWDQYRPFVLQLFGVRVEKHAIYGLTADGYIGLHSAYLWDYPNHPELVLDRGYIESLHAVMKGRGGDRFYVIAPGAVMAFMEDEIAIGRTTYVILKVPLSVLMALIERGEVGSLKQPTGEAGVNEVIDAVGYDFVSQPVVKARYTREAPDDVGLFTQKDLDYVIRISDFRSNTLASDPEDFAPFETFSMALVDTDYDGKTFNLCRVFWADDTVGADRTEAVLRLKEDEVPGGDLMIIFMDKYGNELKVRKAARDFKGAAGSRKGNRKTGKRKT
ncbi:MAG: site-specific DNA-methyltransferase [Pseudomonadota bacterium]